jgi:hypothetical protein
MRVELSGGHYAEFRDQFLRGDRRAARKGMIFVTSADGSQRVEGSLIDDLTGRVITRMLVGWDLDLTPPGHASTEDLAQNILDQLDDDDAAILEAAVGPWVEKIVKRRQAETWTHKATGIVFELAHPADAEKLAVSPDFERSAGEDDPKPGSAPSAISSSASRARTGRRETT